MSFGHTEHWPKLTSRIKLLGGEVEEKQGQSVAGAGVARDARCSVSNVPANRENGDMELLGYPFIRHPSSYALDNLRLTLGKFHQGIFPCENPMSSAHLAQIRSGSTI